MKFGNTEEAFVLSSLKEIVKVWGSGGQGCFNLDCQNGTAWVKIAFQLGSPADQHYVPCNTPHPTLIISIIPIPKFTNNHQDVNDRKGPFDVKKTVYVLQPIGLELPEMNIPLPHHHQLYQQVTLLHHQLYQ